MKVVHSWLKDYVGDSIASPQEIEELLTEHAFEIEGVENINGQDVIEVKILPDRGSDCLSHRGIAREIASITGVPLVHDPLQSTERLPNFVDIEVDIKDDHACTRFAAALVTGVAVKDSPQWLKERLIALGQRPINNIVDATNYVMYALGQPLHAYDADKFPQVDGVWQFEVRFAEGGETVSLIAEGGKEGDRVVELTGSELLIVDKSSNRPIGLAGVKGGAFAGVDNKTTQIILEAAHFDPAITRKTARRLGIVIDASKRNENNPSPELIPHALRDVVLLITEIAGGNCEGSVDVNVSVPNRTAVELAVQQVNALLGLLLTKEEMMDILTRIGTEVADRGEILELTAPFERSDLTIAEDYIEEIGRIYGYSHVVSVTPDAVPLLEINKRHYYSEQIRTLLIQEGFSEVITSSFSSKDTIELQNALARDKSFVRSNLSSNMYEALDKNAHFVDLLGAFDTRIFEIGTVFDKKEHDISEHVSLCIGVRTKVSGSTQKDDALLGIIITKLEQALKIKLQAEIKNGVVECNLTELLSKLPTPTKYEPVTAAKEISYKPFSMYPAMSRDIALWVQDSVTPLQVEAVLNEKAGELRVRTTLVDVFTKEGRTSYAFRLVFQSHEKTLTDNEIQLIMNEVYGAVKEKEWEVR
jgi:phenylalanyl-tRNA synthetase beta chain